MTIRSHSKIAHRGVSLGWSGYVVLAHLIGRPVVSEVIHGIVATFRAGTLHAKSLKASRPPATSRGATEIHCIRRQPDAARFGPGHPDTRAGKGPPTRSQIEDERVATERVANLRLHRHRDRRSADTSTSVEFELFGES